MIGMIVFLIQGVQAVKLKPVVSFSFININYRNISQCQRSYIVKSLSFHGKCFMISKMDGGVHSIYVLDMFKQDFKTLFFTSYDVVEMWYNQTNGILHLSIAFIAFTTCTNSEVVGFRLSFALYFVMMCEQVALASLQCLCGPAS